MKVGIRDVANAAGVSIGTVSKVFNTGSELNIRISDATRDRVLAAARQLNYTPNYGAKLLRGQSSKTIGFTLALPEEHYRSYLSDYTSRILNGLGEEAGRHGYQLLIVNDADYQYYMDINRIDGLVMIAYSLDRNPREAEMYRIFERLNEKKYPYIVINNSYNDIPVPSINIDNRDGIDQIMALIRRKNYRNVGFIGELTPNPQRHHRDRSDYLGELLREAGLPVNPAMFLNGSGNGVPDVPREPGYSHQDGWIGVKHLYEHGLRPDCLVCGNDNIVLGALKYARETGLRIPRDLAIIGFDDIPNAAYFSPALTTVRQPLEEFGQMAFRYLQRKLNDPNYFQSFITKPVLIERESA